MRESAALARKNGVQLHTHLAETLDEERYCLERSAAVPSNSRRLGWIGPDVWHAHMVHPSTAECAVWARRERASRIARPRTCGSGSGIAPLRALLKAGARWAWASTAPLPTMARTCSTKRVRRCCCSASPSRPDAFTAREVLRLATRGGAAVLGRDDIGHLAPGMAADIAGSRIGTWNSPAARCTIRSRRWSSAARARRL